MLQGCFAETSTKNCHVLARSNDQSRRRDGRTSFLFFVVFVLCSVLPVSAVQARRVVGQVPGELFASPLEIVLAIS